MPAKNPGQLRAAFSAQGRGEAWGAEMVSATPDALKKRWMSTTKPKNAKKRKKAGKKSAGKRRSKK